MTATLVMTDKEAQVMAWAMKQTTWFFALRPTSKPANSPGTADTLFSVFQPWSSRCFGPNRRKLPGEHRCTVTVITQRFGCS